MVLVRRHRGTQGAEAWNPSIILYGQHPDSLLVYATNAVAAKFGDDTLVRVSYEWDGGRQETLQLFLMRVRKISQLHAY